MVAPKTVAKRIPSCLRDDEDPHDDEDDNTVAIPREIQMAILNTLMNDFDPERVVPLDVRVGEHIIRYLFRAVMMDDDTIGIEFSRVVDDN